MSGSGEYDVELLKKLWCESTDLSGFRVSTIGWKNVGAIVQHVNTEHRLQRQETPI